MCFRLAGIFESHGCKNPIVKAGVTSVGREYTESVSGPPVGRWLALGDSRGMRFARPATRLDKYQGAASDKTSGNKCANTRFDQTRDYEVIPRPRRQRKSFQLNMSLNPPNERRELLTGERLNHCNHDNISQITRPIF